jgi:hypothetical protein
VKERSPPSALAQRRRLCHIIDVWSVTTMTDRDGGM